MEIETTLAVFRSSGFSLTPDCQNHLKERIVDPVNDAVKRSQSRGDKPVQTKAIEGRGKTYMHLVIKNMIEEGKSRKLKTLDDGVFDAASKIVGALVLD